MVDRRTGDLYLQIWVHPVPHVRDASAIEPDLMAQMRGLDGAMVLLENTPHRDMDVDPARDVEPAPVPVHFESVVPRLTGLRLYAGHVGRVAVVSAARRGPRGWRIPRRIYLRDSPDAVHAELSRWGVKSRVRLEPRSASVLRRRSTVRKRWSADPWSHYEFRRPIRAISSLTNGRGRITGRTRLVPASNWSRFAPVSE